MLLRAINAALHGGYNSPQERVQMGQTHYQALPAQQQTADRRVKGPADKRIGAFSSETEQKRRVNIRLTVIKLSETRLQTDANVILCMLHV